jgi:hypothetical protein
LDKDKSLDKGKGLDKDKNEKAEFAAKLASSLGENTFVKLTLGKYRGSESELDNIHITPVKLKDEIKLSFRYKYKTRDVYKNYDYNESQNIIEGELGKNFLYGGLFTTQNDIVIEYNKRREPRLYTRKASITKIEIKQHNRIKTRYIDSKEPYLNSLGITNPKGEVRGEKYDKFRQIDKFIEIVDSLYSGSSLEEKKDISIVDFGSGKSYLTFALYDYFNNTIGAKTTIKGVEQRDTLVNFSNETAEENKFKGLSFVTGEISEFTQKKADIVTALHACDTATDDAIAKAIRMKAEIIILAPCCQKYVRKRIEIPADLAPIFKHGILEEHLASFVTDGLRALTLESLGYKTKIFEFISPEHTSKNIMITAVKDESNEQERLLKIVEIEKLKSKFGLKDFYLDKILANVKN